jgi:hypothetical protein
MHAARWFPLPPLSTRVALAILFVSPGAAVGGELGDVVQPPVPEVEVGAVVIEAEPPPPEPTVEELMVRFRERLRTERLLAPIERPLAGGLVEVTTRFGRFCVPGVTPFNWSDLTGSFGLASFCAYY